jgi:hypothetical protein
LDKRFILNISAYKDNKLIKFLNDIIPTDKIYDSIISHKHNKPYIINNDNYNKMCTNNETIYVDNLISLLFP